VFILYGQFISGTNKMCLVDVFDSFYHLKMVVLKKQLKFEK